MRTDLPKRGPKGVLATVDRLELRERYLRGDSIKSIAEYLGVCEERTQRILRWLGLSRRWYKKIDPRRFSYWYNRGDSMKSIAQRFNCGLAACKEARKRLGLEPRKSRPRVSTKPSFENALKEHLWWIERWASYGMRKASNLHSIEGALNAALYGFWRAWRLWKPGMGAKLSTYATTRVKGEVSRYITTAYERQRTQSRIFRGVVEMMKSLKAESCS